MEIYRTAPGDHSLPRILTGRTAQRNSDRERFKILSECLTGHYTGVVMASVYDESSFVVVTLEEFFAAYQLVPGVSKS